MPSLSRILLVLVLSFGLASADTIRSALVNLCNPAKITTISAERGANPRVRKIAYCLEMARKVGREPSSEMREVNECRWVGRKTTPSPPGDLGTRFAGKSLSDSRIGNF